MNQVKSYTLYCGETVIVIGEQLPEDCLDYTTADYYGNFVEDCLKGKRKGNFYIQGDADTLLDALKNNSKYVEAAGGYVVNNQNQSLVIIRNGLWDLPKGHVEQNEDIKDAALREVTEETGVSGLEIVSQLPSTYHFYRFNSESSIILKKTYWYSMKVIGTPETKPQTEEGITACMWVDDEKIEEILQRTHRNLKILFKLKKSNQL